MQISQNNGRRRAIRSFVRRNGRLTPSQQRALVELMPDFGLEFHPEPLDFDEIFESLHPTTLEIGFGNGDTLIEQAGRNPGMNFLGIDVHEPGVGRCLLQARDANLNNLRLIVHDAIEVLEHQIPRQSLARVNLYFPDPWPKKRHRKRRIVQSAFVDLIANRLVAGGTFNIATDWENYAEHIDEVMSRSNLFECADRREHDGDRPLDRSRTRFEQRGVQKGHRIYDWCFRKAPNS